MAGTETIETAKAARSMTVQVLKTKTETAIGEAFASHESHLPGGAWLARLRRKAIGTFASLGLPHRRVEEWKYSDLRAALKEAYPLALTNKGAAQGVSAKAALAVFGLGVEFEANAAVIANGHGAGFSGAFAAGSGATPFLAPLLETPTDWIKTEIERAGAELADGAIALNAALFTDGVVLDVPAGASLEAPLIVLYMAGGDAKTRASTYTRSLIRIGHGAKVTLVEAHGDGSAAALQSNAVTQLIIGEDADVAHIKLVDARADDTHVGKTLVRLGARAHYRPFQMTSGSGFVRNEQIVTFNGQHATYDFGAAYLVGDQGHTDTTLVIDHAVPHCTSRELAKGVLDQRARGVFQGKVIVRPDAQKTDGKQMSQALMLSPDAEFDSKPELEIYADDVVCGHGSTSAEIDPDLVFYLRSRGIPADEAMALLVESFIGEALDKVEHEGLREALMGKARAWLERDRMRGAA